MKLEESNISYLLQKLFERHIVNRGHGVYKSHSVKKIKIDSKQGQVHAEVAGTYLYKVKINYNIGNSSITGLRCSCPYDSYCKHQVAVLLALKNNDLLKTTKAKQYAKLKNKAHLASNWRSLPYKNDRQFEELVTELAPSGVNNFMYDFESYEFEAVLKENNAINLLGEQEERYTYYSKSYENIDVDIRKKDSTNFEVKCNVCSKNSVNLCKHLYAGLVFSGSALINLVLKKDYPYKALVTQRAEEDGLSYEEVKERYKIFIGQEGLSIQEKEEDFLSKEGLAYHNKALLSRLNQLYTHPEDAENPPGQTYENALVWSSDWNQLSPEIISGEATKSKVKLKGRLRPDPSASYLTGDLKMGVLEISKHKVTNEPQGNQYERELTQQLALVHEHSSILHRTIQYLNKDRHHYRGVDAYRKSDLQLLDFSPNFLKLIFTIALKDNICRLTIKLLDGHTPLHSNLIKSKNPLFLVFNSGLALVYSKPFDRYVLSFFKGNDTIEFPVKHVSKFASTLTFLKNNYELEIPEEILANFENIGNPSREIYLYNIGASLQLVPVLRYQETYKINALTGLPTDEVINDVKVVPRIDREDFLEWCSKLHPDFSERPHFQSYYTLPLKSFLEDFWYTEFLEECKENEVEVLGYNDLDISKYNTNRPAVSVRIKSGIDWFDTEVDISFGDLKVPLKDWVNMLKNKEEYIKLSDGTLGIIPQQWIDKLSTIASVAKISKGQLGISKFHFNILDDLLPEVSSYDWYQEIQEKKAKLLSFDHKKPFRIPKIINAEMRSYQKQGYQWLRFLDEFGFGACLADDMGLGKTLQVISLLAYLKEKNKCHALVVVPNSLLFNWAREIEKFCPTLRYIIYHGPKRNEETLTSAKYDVIITTYGTATSDILTIKEVCYQYAILDESQAIKNPVSKRNKAMQLIQANNKLIMTGTPIENNTMDLFAQFHFINPGMLGSQGEFVKNFSRPIDINGDKDQATLLKKMIHPFLMRRTKEQVASDLPDKTEVIHYCEMEKAQRKHYDSLLATVRQDVTDHIAEAGVGKSKMKILEALLRLRQICNAVQLVDKSSNCKSAKIAALLEHIQSNEQHKCLVFSQFVSMLSLIKQQLDKLNIKYAYLDGKTRDREAQVEKFQKVEDCRVFLISIKAGNTGLNLTEASYVYIVDPWWNPAVEAQAIDRTHRIGQDKQIFAYRMICKDTIEEKIVKLQEKKKSLSRDLIQVDDNVFKSLDKEELMSLFA